jgi:hypothetical protein
MLKAISTITNALGALNYKGTWNASSNTPTLADGTGAKGDYYVTSTAGTQTFGGLQLFFGIGDWIVYNGAVWQRVEGGSDGNFSNVTLTSTDAGAAAAPLLDLYRDSASPAASDTLGEIEFNGEDSAGNKQQYAVIHASILSPTSTAETGQIHFETATAGASTEKMIIGSTNLVINDIGAIYNVRIEGDTDANLFYTDATNSRVGIGTSSPSEKLDVAGNVKLSGVLTAGAATSQNSVFDAVVGTAAATTGDTSGVVIVNNATGTGYIGFNNANNASIPGQVTYNHNTNLMTFYSSGTISTNGIYSNTTANAANMHVDSSGILYRSTSTEKYKTDIEPISQNYSDNVLNLKPIWYRSKTDNSNWSWYGLSAEDVALKDPRLSHWGYPEDCYEIIHNKNGEPKKVLKPNSKLVPDGVQYERIAVLLLDVVKRLKEDFEQYKALHP